MPVEGAPSGWYPDAAADCERYWDGTSWTDETRQRLSAAEVPPSSEAVIAGFWRRSVAFTIDGLLLGLVGAALGFGLFDVMAGLGAWGRLVGFAISLAYFGLLDGAAGGGQTLGKRLMKVRVVDRAGTTLPVWKTVGRFTILAAPSYLNNLAVPVTAMSPAITYLVGFILFGVGGASLYLYVFNRATRQSVHDLAVGSFVVQADSHGTVEAQMWRGHLAVTAGLLSVALLGTGAASLLAQRLPSGLYEAVEALNETGELHTASVFIGKSWGNDKVSDCLSVNAVVKENPDNPDVLMAGIVKTVVRAYPKAKEADYINVNLTYGFDLGIATGWRNVGDSRTPADWARETGFQ